MSSFSRLSAEIPILETERLRLRGHRIDDFTQCAAMWADPVVTQYVGGKPFTAEETWAKLLRYAGHWGLLGYGYWVIEDKNTEEFFGEVGFADYKRELQPPLQSVPEIGWALASRAHGRGYATEAVRAVVAWGDEEFKSASTACIIAPDNASSIRVAVKCGYTELQSATYMGWPRLVFIRQPRAAS
jgi:RimJ/RimL family protein N-acetyltransferase